MRFLFGGLAIFVLVAFIVGQIITPRYASMRKVFARGFYYSGIGLLILAVFSGIIGLIYYGIEDANQPRQRGLSEMSAQEKTVYLDSLLHNPPQPAVKELKDVFVNYRFGFSALPCFESVHRFNIVSLEEIKSLEITGTNLSGKIFEINTRGEFLTNQPLTEFHVKGSFTLQYRFSEGTRDLPPGWNLSQIVGNECTVLSKIPEKKIIGRDSLYPDLKRKVE